MRKPCGCGGKQPGSRFQVTNPNGSTEIVRSEIAAKIAAAKSGGTYKKMG